MPTSYLIDAYEALVYIQQALVLNSRYAREVLQVGIFAHFRANLEITDPRYLSTVESLFGDSCYIEDLHWLEEALSYDYQRIDLHKLHESLQVIDCVLMPQHYYRQWLLHTTIDDNFPHIVWHGSDFVPIYPGQKIWIDHMDPVYAG